MAQKKPLSLAKTSVFKNSTELPKLTGSRSGSHDGIFTSTTPHMIKVRKIKKKIGQNSNSQQLLPA
jgi:hypothetical protein